MKKKILAFALAFTIIVYSCVSSYEVAYATGFEEAILGSLLSLSAPEVFVVCALSLGTVVTVKYVYDNWDRIEADISNRVEHFDEWLENAKTGIIDTSSQVFTNIKNWLFGNNQPIYGLQGIPVLKAGSKIYKTDSLGKSQYYYFNSDVLLYMTNDNLIHVCCYYGCRIFWGYDSNSSYTGASYLNNYKVNGNNISGTIYSFSTTFSLEDNKSIIGIIPQDLTEIYTKILNYYKGNSALDNINPLGQYGYINDLVTDGSIALDNIDIISDAGDSVISLPKDWVTDQVVSKVLTGELTYDDVIDITGTLPVVKDIDLDLDYPIEKDGVSNIPYEPTLKEENPSVPSIPSDNEVFTIQGLEKLFPFCIPFDIYNLLSCLAAEPETPKYTWKFTVLGQTYDLEIDLSPFDGVASILRSGLVLVFCVGLALKTRDLIRG